MRKYFLIAILLVSSQLQAKSLSDKERFFLFNNLPLMMVKQWDQPEVTACWRSGTTGDDRALHALYVIHKSIVEIEKNAKATEHFIKSNSSPDGFKGRVADLLKQRDAKALQVILKVMPQAIQYCETLMNEKEILQYRENTK